MLNEAAATVESELLDASARLMRAGVANHRREALQIWADLESTSPAEIWLRRHRTAAPTAVEKFHAAVDRRCAGEPVQYATGSAAFRHLLLAVDDRVLIPRPETEGLVEIVIDWAKNQTHTKGLDVLEIGVGSGCIILSLAVEGSFGRLVATDISQDALTVAEQNRKRVCPGTKVDFRLGSFYEPVEGETFDAIVSNPPYVTEQEYARLEPGVREHEPKEALVSGEAGLYHTRMICEGALRVLSPGGLLAVEIDAERDLEAQALAVSAGFNDATIQRDLFGRPRYLVATSPKTANN